MTRSGVERARWRGDEEEQACQAARSVFRFECASRCHKLRRKEQASALSNEGNHERSDREGADLRGASACQKQPLDVELVCFSLVE